MSAICRVFDSLADGRGTRPAAQLDYLSITPVALGRVIRYTLNKLNRDCATIPFNPRSRGLGGSVVSGARSRYGVACFRIDTECRARFSGGRPIRARFRVGVVGPRPRVRSLAPEPRRRFRRGGALSLGLPGAVQIPSFPEAPSSSAALCGRASAWAFASRFSVVFNPSI